MFKNYGRIIKKQKLILMLILSAFIISSYGIYFTSLAAKTETVDLRIVFTTDLHGQVNSTDYETGKSYNVGGLSKAFSLIKTARNQRSEGNTLTFDLGDVLYDYTTEYIFGEDQGATQPIYNALKYVGYDAIVLGNHDYDYGYQYILNQLNSSGMRDVTVVSNVWEADTGDSPFLPYMLLDKELTAKSGRKVNVKIGIIGESIPNLSSKTSSYTGILKTEDMVANVKSRSKELKEQGADVIIVIAHTGIGPEEPEVNYKNVGYALTKIKEVDVILCGHEHNMYPTPDNTNNAYYKLPGVDPSTGLINDKAVVMSADRGQSIGLVDLTITNENSTNKITNKRPEIRKVNPATVKEDANIKAMFDAWEEKILEYSNSIVATIEQGTVIHNYFGLVRDNTSIQLLNDAKMAYAISSINTISTAYKNHPVIAVSTYNKYGQGSASDYVNLKGEVVESQLASIQMYNNYLHLYTITGKQLKEWLEWTASAYSYGDGSTPAPLLNEEWMYDWDHFYVFDGIYYEISPSILPRYNKNGVKINNSNRITKLLYNGVEVTDSMEFVIASDKITKTTQATQGLDKQQIQKGFIRSQTALSKYMSQLGTIESIKETYDDNWRIIYPKDYNFIVPSSPNASIIAKTQEWYDNTLEERTFEYLYHVGSYDNMNNSYTETPHVVLVSTNNDLTNKDIDIVINASDSSGIKRIQYLKGDYNISANEWNSATEVKRSFSVAENSIYTVLVTNNKDKKAIAKININNINKGILQAPKVDNYTNRKAKITGTAEPNSNIYFEVGKLLYDSKVDSNGKFSYALPSKDADTKIYVYVKDEEGRISNKTRVNVKRTGPNRLTLKKVTNNIVKYTGKNAEEGVQIFAIINNTVYVSKKGGKKAYQGCNIFSEDYNIVETAINPGNEETGGKYTITVPVQKPGTLVTVYAIDYAGRVSRKTTKTVQSVAPNPPTINEICNAERYVSGHTDLIGEYGIIVKIGDDEFETTTDENGKYSVKIGKVNIGDIIKVYTTEVVEGVLTQSYYSQTTVTDVLSYDLGEYSYVSVNPVTDKSIRITGEYEAYETFTLIVGNEVYEIEADGYSEFTFDLEECLPEGTKIHAISRSDDGDIFDTSSLTVTKAVPITPELMNEVTNNSQTIEVTTDKGVTVFATIGKDVYKTKKGYFDYEEERYVYIIEIPKTNSKTDIKIHAENEAGKSKSITAKVTKLTPNSPKVKAMYIDSDRIEGKTDEDAIRVYAKIKKESYKAKVDEDGSFSIKIPKQKEKTVIKVWSVNEYGEGPEAEVVVKKK